MQFDIIAAVDSKFGLAKDGLLPWAETPEGRADMKHFKSRTVGGVVIMGSRTYRSIGRPLPARVNIVISRAGNGLSTADNIICVSDFESALNAAYLVKDGLEAPERIFVIGGATLYSTAIKHPMCRNIVLTQFDADYNCDLFFPSTILARCSKWTDDKDGCSVGGSVSYKITEYAFNNIAEVKYLDLLRKLTTAPIRANRTGIHTRGLFAKKLKFKLTQGGLPILPLITTKRVPFKMVAAELVWFLHGQTNVDFLHEHGCKIWDANSTREFLDGRGLDYPEGECGPIYGYQWRRWNRPYDGAAATNLPPTNTPYIDQLADVIGILKTDPMSRRMVVSAWNPDQISEMVLPPCHWSFQFYCVGIDSSVTTPTYKLNCLVNMRSADMALGVPFNIASYALLTHIIAQIVGMKPGKIAIVMADCHLYTNHLDGAHDQLLRWPRLFPLLNIDPAIKSLDDIKSPAQFTISEYYPHGAIKYDMAV